MISEEELAELALWWRDRPESSIMRLVAEITRLKNSVEYAWSKFHDMEEERDAALAEVERLRGLIFDDSPITPEEEAWARSVVEDGG